LSEGLVNLVFGKLGLSHRFLEQVVMIGEVDRIARLRMDLADDLVV